MGSISHSHLSDRRWFLTVKTYAQNQKVLGWSTVEKLATDETKGQVPLCRLFFLLIFFFCSVCSDCLPLPHVYSKRFIDFLTLCYFSSPRLFFPELQEVSGDCCYARCISVLWSSELHLCWNNASKAQTYYKLNCNFQVITYHWVMESKTV